MLSHEVEQLVAKLPPAWQGLLAALNARDAVHHGALWLLENEHTNRLNWPQLLASLVVDEPKQVDPASGALIFTPRMMLLPPHLVRALLSFIMENKHKIPFADLKEFSKKLKESIVSLKNSWIIALLQMFPDSQNSISVYDFAPENSTKVQKLQEELSQGELENTVTHNSVKPNEIDIGEAQEKKDVTVKMQIEEDMETEIPGKVQRADEVNEAVAAKEMSEALDEKEMVGVTKLREYLVGNAESIDGDIKYILTVSTNNKLEMILNQMEIQQMTESCVMKFSRLLCGMADSLITSRTILLMGAVLLTRVLELLQSASRMLLSAVSLLASTFPSQLLDAVLLPLATDSHINSSQTDFLQRVLQENYDEHQQLHFIRLVVQGPNALHSGIVPVLQVLLDKKLPVEADDFSSLTQMMERTAGAMAKNLKFGKLILTVIKKYGTKLSMSHMVSIQACLDMHDTFLSKTARAALQRLQDQE